jgi:hypothetical protein
MNLRSRALYGVAPGIFLCVLVFAIALPATAQRWGNNPFQGKLQSNDQKRFDDYYAKWISNRERKDLGEIASMEARMLDVYAHNGISSDVPYDLVASPNVAVPINTSENWRNRLRGDDQKRFDDYYTRWLGYRNKKDKEQIASMQGRMLDVYAHDNVPLTTPYELVASPNVVPGNVASLLGAYPNNGYPNNAYPNGNPNNGYPNNGYPNNGGNLQILQAYYGAPGRQIDVAGRLQGMVTNRGLSIRVNNDSMGSDPAPNTPKQLYVVYSFRGQQRSATVSENQDLRIP